MSLPRSGCPLVGGLALLTLTTSAPAEGPRAALADLLGEVRAPYPLLDRALPIAPLAALDGSEAAPALDTPGWRAVADEIRLSFPNEVAADWERVLARDVQAETGPIPIGVIALRASRLREAALDESLVQDGRLRLQDPLLETTQVVAVAPLASHTHRGERVAFVAGPEFFVGDAVPARIELDFDDGRGWRTLVPGAPVRVSWSTSGRKSLRTRLTMPSGEAFFAHSVFDVHRLGTPLPSDTLFVTATEPWQGQVASGEAFVYLAPAHAAITNPVVIFEGFDLDNSLNWEELYLLLNQQNLLETLRADGYDAVVLNFDEATEPIQRNAFLAAELVQQVNAMIDPGQDIFVIGASMGGLVGRHALSWMEQQAIPHNTRTFLAFDTPHGGANIPLGIQYWLDFFAELSSEAAFLLSRLDTPAARQMLVYHHKDPPQPTGSPDPLRAAFLADLAAVGDWPTQSRTVAVADGASTGLGQGFAPAEQIIRYEYRSFLLDICGNVWAVPDGSSALIFDGELDYFLLPDSNLEVTVSGTQPFDNAPGGYRDSMAEMDAVPAPFGDIVALHDNHCFIPTISGLALNTTDLAYDIDGDPNLLALTPVDAVYFTSEPNLEHVEISAAMAPWLLDEIRVGAVGVAALGAGSEARLSLAPPAPNPVRGDTSIRFTLPTPERVRVALFDVTGRLVDALLDRHLEPGAHEITWSVRPELASGVYYLDLRAGGERRSRGLVVVVE